MSSGQCPVAGGQEIQDRSGHWPPVTGLFPIAARLAMTGPWDGCPVTIHGPADHRAEGWNCTIHARDGQDYYTAVHPMNLAEAES